MRELLEDGRKCRYVRGLHRWEIQIGERVGYGLPEDHPIRRRVVLTAGTRRAQDVFQVWRAFAHVSNRRTCRGPSSRAEPR